MVSNVNTGNQNPPPFPGIGGGTGYLFFHYWPPVKREPAINVDMVNEFTEETFLNVKTEIDTEENLDKNEILKIISDYIEGTERFTDKTNSTKS